MGREDATEENPMGFVPEPRIPDEKETKKLLARFKADAEAAGAADDGDDS